MSDLKHDTNTQVQTTVRNCCDAAAADMSQEQAKVVDSPLRTAQERWHIVQVCILCFLYPTDQ